VSASSSRAYLAPEVIQASMMDCGPASLQSLLAGFGIDVGYGRLREACSTDVDGTSIDTLEDVAVELGLDAEQVMVPVDHLLLDEADVVPALLVLQRPHAPTHYVVLWRKYRGWVQIMDPAVGRRWVRASELMEEVYRHEMLVPAEAWRDYVDSDVFRGPLARRLADIGVAPPAARALIEAAARDPTWRGFAQLDAATRLTGRLVGAGGIVGGGEAQQLVERLASVATEEAQIPAVFWTVRALPEGGDEEQILHRGAVLIRVAGRVDPAAKRETTAAQQLAPELLAALRRPAATPWRPFFDALKNAGGAVIAVVGTSLAIAAGTVLAQALLFRSVLDIGYWLGIAEHRVGAVLALAFFLLAALLLDLPITATMQRLGRRLEVLLRLAFARKMPRTADHYFHSRPLSDLAERAQSIAVLRTLPAMAGALFKGFFQLAFTAAAILWLAPWLTGWVAALVSVSVVLSLISPSILQEREMRARSHGGVLVRFYFDALLGVSTLRAHGAGTALMREQEGIVVQWAEAQRRLARTGLVLEAIQSLVGAGLAIGLVDAHLAREGTTGSILLVTYWALQLPVLAQSLALASRQIPAIRNVLVRVLEPLEAPE
jgi:ABC-type bacteriocin/lantibiotic exporter with double-glycine peptidase domain